MSDGISKSILKLKLECIFLPYTPIAFIFCVYYLVYYFNYPISEQLQSYTKTERSYSLVLFIYFLVVYYYGNTIQSKHRSQLGNSNNFKYLLRFTIVSIIVLICIIFMTTYTIKPSNEYKKDLNISLTYYGKKYFDINIDSLQFEEKCCSFLDDNLKKEKLPYSCCSKPDENYRCLRSLAYQKTCYETYLIKLNYFKGITFIIGTISIFIQLFTTFLFYFCFRKVMYSQVDVEMK